MPCSGASALQVIEVNGVAAWQGLQRVTGFNIAQALRSAWAALGGFDEMLGTGAPCRSGEELVLALRALQSLVEARGGVLNP